MTAEVVAPRGLDNRVVGGGFDTTWRELEPLDLPGPCAVMAADNLVAARAVRAAVESNGEILIASRGRLTPDLAESLRANGFWIIDGEDRLEPTAPRDAVAGRVSLLTSGSTGRPKQVAHTLSSLTTVGGDQPSRVWLCPYTTGAYAWWQVVTLGLMLPGQDVVFVEPGELETWPQLALRGGVTAASGTPTFWRQALYRDPDTVSQLPLEQITLGGEPVDQSILTRLADLFPKARVSWIYASSEAGATIAVHDGQAGFPAEWLDRRAPGRATVSVVDGELLIASAKRGEGIDEVLHTGDRAEIVGDRVMITGRLASDEINVGGAKASAGQVRDVLQAHPKVAWAAVKGRRAPLVGNMVTARVVPDGEVTEAELTAWCTARLPDYAVPRRITFLESIPLKETLKSDV